MEWFRSYLTNRKQYVSYKETGSSIMDITYGVPRGFVLGPLLFIIYANDLPGALIESKCILFVDDTTVYYSSKNITNIFHKINNDLNSREHINYCCNKISSGLYAINSSKH